MEGAWWDHCGEDRVAPKPFPNRNLCYEATRKLPAVNTLGGDVYMCQTILPCEEAMPIPNLINRGTTALLAVPGPEYGPETKPGGAHYYINSPGVSVHDPCMWGNNTFGAGNVILLPAPCFLQSSLCLNKIIF
ncbi:hypothetical protein BZA77DRAFT_255225 [Pyronema omphalodes]|nr:hypothetical protein BZA77DRAFT_255225 [Pyronema omphalodes]